MGVRVRGAIHGIGSVVAAFGLWHIHSWKFRVLWAWAAASIAVAWLPHVFPSNMAPLWSSVIGTILVMAVLAWVNRYVQLRVPRPE